MKKITFLALIVFLFSSCLNETTQVVEKVEPYTSTQVYKIYAEDMSKRTDVGGIVYFEYEFKEPKLTKKVFDFGILQAFLYYKKDGKDTLCPLPFSDFLVDKNGYQWEEQFTVEFQPGVIKFIQKISDYAEDPPVSEFYEVLVRFLW